jgi:hypothetical protein
MAYHKDLDEKINVFNIDTSTEDNESSLQLSIMSYNNKSPKLQIGPRTFLNAKGDTVYRRSGRLSVNELEKLQELLPKIIEKMKEQS